MRTTSLPPAQQRALRQGLVYRAHVIVTHVCNLSCAHCYQSEHRSADLSSAELDDVFAQLADLGCLYLTLGGGEPLARSDFWDLLGQARRRGFAVDVYSNGTLIDAAAARRLREAGVTHLEISVHGAGSQTHDPFVGRRGAFDQTVRAIGHLRAVGLPVKVKTNLTRRNVREWEALESLWKTDPGVHLAPTRHLHPRDDGDGTPLLDRLDAEQERSWWAGRMARLSADELQRRIESWRRSCDDDLQAAAPCQAARTTLAIHPNGDVTPCTQSSGHVMGNLRQRRLADIWADSVVGRRFRALSQASFAQADDACARCPWRSVCQKCAALSHDEAGGLDRRSPQVCQSTQTYWAAITERARILSLPGADLLPDPSQIPPPPQRADPSLGPSSLVPLHIRGTKR